MDYEYCEYSYKDYFNEEFSDYRDLQRSVEHAEDHFKAIVDIIYGDGELDAVDFEGHLDEVATLFGMKLPDTQPNVERPKNLFDLACNIVRHHARMVS